LLAPIVAGEALAAGNIANIAQASNAASGDWDSNPQGRDNWVVDCMMPVISHSSMIFTGSRLPKPNCTGALAK